MADDIKSASLASRGGIVNDIWLPRIFIYNAHRLPGLGRSGLLIDAVIQVVPKRATGWVAHDGAGRGVNICGAPNVTVTMRDSKNCEVLRECFALGLRKF